MDLKCSTTATGPSYYRECLAKVGEIRRRPDTNRLVVGDRVSVCLDPDVLQAMSRGHGGWVDDMVQVNTFLHFYMSLFRREIKVAMAFMAVLKVLQVTKLCINRH